MLSVFMPLLLGWHKLRKWRGVHILLMCSGNPNCHSCTHSVSFWTEHRHQAYHNSVTDVLFFTVLFPFCFFFFFLAREMCLVFLKVMYLTFTSAGACLRRNQKLFVENLNNKKKTINSSFCFHFAHQSGKTQSTGRLHQDLFPTMHIAFYYFFIS